MTDHSHNLGPRCSLPDLRRRVKSQTFSSLLHSLPGWLPHGPLFSLWWTAGATKQGRSRVDNRFLESLCIARCHRSSLGSLDRPAMPRLTAFQEALIWMNEVMYKQREKERWDKTCCLSPFSEVWSTPTVSLVQCLLPLLG